MSDLVAQFDLDSNALGHLTSSVQFGFITGTLIFALLTISDRFSPSRVFLFSALAGALFNLCMIWGGNQYLSLLILRFLTGFFLAGIYPVGMKIAADYYEKGLGKSLGFLVGALVLGTAFPHFLKVMTTSIPWQSVILSTSGFATIGGALMILFVPDGPFRKPAQQIRLSAFTKVFQNPPFRSAAFGYFGHMWELYAFWTFVPLILAGYSKTHPEVNFDTSLWSFFVIGIGSLACMISGYLSQFFQTKKVAFSSLILSCICCLISPFMFAQGSTIIFILFLFFWGMVVIADSPLFSTLVAQNADPKAKGTALTIVNCLGFAITIVSIQLLNSLSAILPTNNLYIVLAIGPVIGLYILVRG